MPFSKDLLTGSSGNQGGGSFYEYQIEQSCGFHEGTSSRLYRDFGTPSDATKLTISFWLKLVESEVDGYHMLFSRGTGYGGGGATAIGLTASGVGGDDSLTMYGMAGDGGGNNGANNAGAGAFKFGF